jgi:TM2 domain-containing membrane protein YozV
MAYDVSFVHAFVAIGTAILSSSLFCKLDRFCRGKFLKCVCMKVRSSVSNS